MDQTYSSVEWSRLVRTERGIEWLVDGKPFIAYSGEAHNSSGSSTEHMRKHVWPAAKALHCNAVIVPVYWELCEPEEGIFDFALVDDLLADAREAGQRLILLWFGTLKNAVSTYAPGWVKRDRKRFPRARRKDGNACGHTCLTVCSEAVAEADGRAFAALMKHLREADSDRHTVVMIQVENETGILGTPRDFSPEAEAVFAGPVPQALLDGLAAKGGAVRPELNGWKRGTTWTECFGPLADEVFSAWCFASFLQKVTAAGRREYPLPCYVNAWLVYPGQKAGDYPSGGPVTRMKDIWQIAAPDVAFLAPDIYQPCFREICNDYAARDNPLFIPEAHRNATAVPHLLYAVGQCGALCFSPFGFEDMLTNAVQTIVGNEIFDDGTDRGNHDSGVTLAAAYAMMRNMEPALMDARRSGGIGGFLQTADAESDTVTVDGIAFHAEYRAPAGGKPEGAGIVFRSGDYFYVAGIECSVYPDGDGIEVESIDEGRFVQGEWVRGRRLNGDEFGCWFGGLPNVLRLKLIRK